MIVIKNNSLRKVLKIVIPFIAIPSLVILSAFVFQEKGYFLISVGVVVLAVILFMSGFEKKFTGSRRMVLVVVMTALCVAGRFIPFFKPVTALTVITAMYLGGEAGFLTGSLAAVLSNFYFGQGPWTPFQMLAWGLIGLIAGCFAEPLKKSKVSLLIFGVLSGVVYSMAMDVWTVLSYNGTFNLNLYLAAFVTALPHTILYSISNFVFLYFLGKPFGEKFERIKIKYGV